MSESNEESITSDFELTDETLDQWEAELDEFQERMHQRLALLSLAGDTGRPNSETRNESDAIRLTQSIEDMLS